MTRTLDIWWDGRLVGQLTQNQHGELGFAYASVWLDDEAIAALVSLAAEAGGAVHPSRVPPVLQRAPAGRKPARRRRSGARRVARQ
jgi:HipA-like protein